MFPNNPLFVDKLIQSRQEDIERGLPQYSTHDQREAGKSPIRLRAIARIWVPVGAILLLAWGLHFLF